MATATYPFNVVGQKAYEDQFKTMFTHLGDGVLNDSVGTGCRLTANGTNRTVTVGPGDFKVAGFVRESDDTVPLDASAVGTQPGAGQSRRVVAVMSLDLTAKSITPVLRTGSPTTGVPARPALTRTDTVYDAPFWSYIDSPNATTSQALAAGRESAWIGPTLYLPAGAPLPDPASLGTTVHKAGVTWRRVLVGAVPGTDGVPAWVQDNPFITLGGDTINGARAIVGRTTAEPNLQGDWGLNLAGVFSQVLFASVEPFGTDPLVHSVVDATIANYRWRFRFPGGGVVGAQKTSFQVQFLIIGV